jgi:hypothetical protein
MDGLNPDHFDESPVNALPSAIAGAAVFAFPVLPLNNCLHKILNLTGF